RAVAHRGSTCQVFLYRGPGRCATARRPRPSAQGWRRSLGWRRRRGRHSWGDQSLDETGHDSSPPASPKEGHRIGNFLVTEYQISTATFPNDFSNGVIWSLGRLGCPTSAIRSDRLHNLLGMIGACARIAGEVKVKIAALDKPWGRSRGMVLSFCFVARSLQRKEI